MPRCRDFRTTHIGGLALPRPSLLRPGRKRTRGQSVVELALILPVMLLVLFAALDFGRIYLGWVNLQSMSRTAANYAANHADAWFSPDNAVKQEARARYNELVVYDAERINCELPSSGVGDPDIPDPVIEGMALGSDVTVSIICLFDPITPIIGDIVGDQVQVGSHAVFPVKSGGSGANGPGAPATPPVASFLASPSSGYAPLTVDFVDTSTGSPTSWVWNFGDGANDLNQFPGTHTYDLTGGLATTYVARLRVCNSGGCSDAPPITIDVIPPPTSGPIPSFTATPRTGIKPLNVSFTDTSTGPPAVSWAWDLDGDGSVDSTNQDPSFVYNADGSYDVTLTVSDGTTQNTLTSRDFIVVTPRVCVVPSFAGVRKNRAQQLWSDEGFSTTVSFLAGQGNYTIQYQSQPALSNPPGGCDADLTVGP